MRSDRFVVWTVLVVVAGAWVAAFSGVFGGGAMTLVVPTAVTLVGAFVGSWQLNRGDRLRRQRTRLLRADDRRNLAGALFVDEFVQAESSQLDESTRANERSQSTQDS